MGHVVEGWKKVGRQFADGSPALKAYILFQLAGPVGIFLAVRGQVSHDDELMVIGLVLLGLALVDMIFVRPIMSYRRDVRRREQKRL
jgi:hypothetical protein